MAQNSGDFKKKFQPPAWLKNPHLQTIYPALHGNFLEVAFREQRMPLPDGDFLELAFCGQKGQPCMLLLPGTEGSVRSAYIKCMTDVLVHNDWQVCVMQYRSCGKLMNNHLKTYNCYDTQDLLSVIEYLSDSHQITIEHACGFSIGGNLLLHYLHENPSSDLTAIACLSTPFNLIDTVQELPSWYQRYLVRSFIKKAKIKINQGMALPIGKTELETIKRVFDFDNKLTAPIYGFKDAIAYYQRASCLPLIPSIQTPVLMIHAQDDPFIPQHTVPNNDDLTSSQVTILSTPHGGHLGFVSSHSAVSKKYWYIEKMLSFFDQHT